MNYIQKHIPFYENLHPGPGVEFANSLAELAASTTIFPSCICFGIGGGRNVLALAAGCAARGSGVVVGVDTWASGDEGDNLRKGFLTALSACPPNVADKISVLNMRPELAAVYLEGGPAPTTIVFAGDSKTLVETIESSAALLGLSRLSVVLVDQEKGPAAHASRMLVGIHGFEEIRHSDGGKGVLFRRAQ